MEIINSMLSAVSTLTRPGRKFLQILFTTMLYLPGKVNYRNLSRYSALSEMTYLRQFRKPFAFESLNRHLIDLGIACDHQRIAALDCSFIPKSGTKTYGRACFFNGKASRAEKGLELSHSCYAERIALVEFGCFLTPL